MTVTDTRFGRRASSGRIVSMPERYVTGEAYNRGVNPAPTMLWLNDEYFVLLPIAMGSVKPDVMAELRQVVGIAASPTEQPTGGASTAPVESTPAKLTVKSSKPVASDAGE